MTVKPEIFVSSLLINVGVMVITLTSPAQAMIQQNTITSPQDIVGYTITFTDTLGRNLTGISLSSPDFPFTSFTGSGTDSITANFFGAIPANTLFTVQTNIADPVGIWSTLNTYTEYRISNGVPTPFTLFSSGFTCSTTAGSGTIYLTASRTTPFKGVSGLVQCQGDTFGRINPTNTDFTDTLSIKPISGYQDPNTLGTFPPYTTYTIPPGYHPNLVQAFAEQTVPEPSTLLGLTGLALFGTVSTALKRRKISK